MLKITWIFFYLFLVLFTFSLVYGIFLWIKRRQYTREKFAFSALSTIALLTLTLISSLTANSTPWNIVVALFNYFLGISVPVPNPSAVDYGFILLAYFFAVQAIIKIHRQWDGLKSYEQYQREQRRESPSLFVEAASELRQIKVREHARALYQPEKSNYISQLQPVSDSLVWHEQAKDLLRLSSSSYFFDSETGWHANSQCWVGTNVNTNEQVFLFPFHYSPTDSEITFIISYSQKINKINSISEFEIIIAIRSNDADFERLKSFSGIRIETESSLLDSLIDFSDYKNEISKRVESLNLPDSNLSIGNVFVSPEITRENDHDDSPSELKYLLLEWLESTTDQKQIALLGEYGQRKSTAALMYSYYILTRTIQCNRVPILIELRGTSPRNLTPLQLLGAWASQYNINPQSLMRLHIAGKLLLIFEGFDEMALVGDAEMRLKHFKVLWQFCYPKSKIVITGRPNFFLDENEMKSALGISEPKTGHPYCEAIRLKTFSPNKISESLREHDEIVREQISALVKTNERFYELVSRPSLLHIVAVLWVKENLNNKVEDLTSAYVMELFVKHSYRRQGLKEYDVPEFMALTSGEREYFMFGIASFMAARHLPNQISSSQLNELIIDLIEAIPDSISRESSAMDAETTEPIRDRIKNSKHAVEHIKTDVRTCGLLVDDPAAPGTFRFGHKSFMEYLFAAIVGVYLQNNQSVKESSILRATNATPEDILYLPVSLEFLSEILSSPLNRNTHKTEINNKDEKIASQLLNVILETNNLFFNIIIKVLSFNLFFSCSVENIKTPFYRFLAKMFLFQNIAIILFCIIINIYINPKLLNIFPFLKISFIENLSFLKFVVICEFLVIPSILYYSIINSLYRKLRLWNSLCCNLKLSGESLNKTAKINIFPWVKGKRFDYFLEDNDSCFWPFFRFSSSFFLFTEKVIKVQITRDNIPKI